MRAVPAYSQRDDDGCPSERNRGAKPDASNEGAQRAVMHAPNAFRPVTMWNGSLLGTPPQASAPPLPRRLRLPRLNDFDEGKLDAIMLPDGRLDAADRRRALYVRQVVDRRRHQRPM